MSGFLRTTDSYRQGAFTLPGRYYTSGEVLARETELILRTDWHCVCRSAAIPENGDYVVREIAGESLILVRDGAGKVRAHFNVCRHRGTRLCTAERGHFTVGIRCPYHAWTYSLEGRLLGAPYMSGVDGFDRDDYSLHRASVAEYGGFVFLNVHEEPEPFEQWFAPMSSRLDRFNLHELSSHHAVSYDVAANWKLIFQNYSECMHCPSIHPELSAVLPFQSGANDLIEGPFLGGYMEIAAPNDSATMTGRACAALVNPALTGAEQRRAWYYSLLPNMLLSVHPDYVNYYTLTPLAPDRTLVRSEWLFRDAADPSRPFNPADAIEFWDRTNRQDWQIVEQNQQGVASSRYVPGPYSPRESIPAAWDREWARRMGLQQQGF